MELIELVRPWKLAVFIAGMAWLLWGAVTYRFPDWDVGISVLMGLLAYLFAPWVVRLITTAVRYRRPGWVLSVMVALVVTWAVVDGSYLAYNTLLGHPMLRIDNALVSSALFFGLGVAVSYRGSARELAAELFGKPNDVATATAQASVIPIDFNNADEDGAYRLHLPVTSEYLQANGLELHEGMEVEITDGELLARARVTYREGIWVAVVVEWKADLQ